MSPELLVLRGPYHANYGKDRANLGGRRLSQRGMSAPIRIDRIREPRSYKPRVTQGESQRHQSVMNALLRKDMRR